MKQIISESDKKNKLKKDLNIITEIINKHLDKIVVSIINYGSYGRNEGSFYKENNLLHTYNDYDILIVTDEIISNEIIDTIEKESLKHLSIKWIDISQIKIVDLNKMKPTIFNFDLKYGSNIIYGNKQILNEIPTLNTEELTLKDAEILFFTRLWTLLGSFAEKGFIMGLVGEQSRFFRNQMSKAIFSVIDILLIQNKNYHWSYKERLEIITSIYPNNKEYINLFHWAYNERINPSGFTMQPKEVQDLYSKVHSMFFKEMFIALSKFYNKEIHSTIDIDKHYNKSFKSKLIRFKGHLLNQKQYSKLIALKLNQSYIAEYFMMDNLMKIKAEKTILKNFQIIDKNIDIKVFDWDKLRLLIADIRMGV